MNVTYLGIIAAVIAALFIFIRKILESIHEINRYHRGEQMRNDSDKFNEVIKELDLNIESAKVKYKRLKDELKKDPNNSSDQ